jgi:hypothetical protein
MNAKQKNSILSESEIDKTQKELDIKDLKLPFDMKSFWKSTNDKYFKSSNELNVHEISHLMYYYSKYGILIIVNI